MQNLYICCDGITSHTFKLLLSSKCLSEKRKQNKYVKGKNVQTKLNEGEMERKKACVEFIN
jgi:hypothetical protein